MIFPVTFKTSSTSQNSYGELESTLTNVVKTGCTVSQMKLEEEDMDGLEGTRETIECIAKYTPTLATITTRDKLTFKSNTYDIIGIDQYSFKNDNIKFIARRTL